MSNLIAAIAANVATVAPELGMYDGYVIEQSAETVTIRSKEKYLDILAKVIDKLGPPSEQATVWLTRSAQWHFPGGACATLIGRPITRQDRRGGVHLTLVA